MDPLSLVESTRGKYSAQSVTGHFPANLGICPVDFPLCPTKLILAAMYIGHASMSEHFLWLTMSTASWDGSFVLCREYKGQVGMDPLSLVEYKGQVGMDPLSLVEYKGQVGMDPLSLVEYKGQVALSTRG